jgi:hypothetical protein
MHSVANAYIDYPAVAFTPNAQFLPTAMEILRKRGISDTALNRNTAYQG